MRAGVLGQKISSKIFVTDRRINERRGRGDNASKTKGARGTTLLVRIGFRRVTVAIVARGFRFHLRATIGLLDFWNEWLPRNRSERDRSAERETGDKPECSSHGPMIRATTFEFNRSH